MGKGSGKCDQSSMLGMLSSTLKLPAGIEDPETTIPGVGAAASHLAQALLEGKKIAVFADYDADGTASAAILKLALQGYEDQILWGFASSDRGTGLSEQFVRAMHKREAGVLVTVDLGSGQPSAVQLARELGMQTIITDHHHPHPDLKADYHLNPQLHTSGHQASGANVAYKLALELGNKLSGQPSEEMIGRGAWLAGFAARADLMDMNTAENQTLDELTAGHKWAQPGLKAAAEEMGLRSLAKSNQAKIATLLNMPKRTPLAQGAWSAHILSAKSEEEARPYIRQLMSVRERCQSVQRDYLGQAWSEHEQNLGTPMALARIDQDDSHLFAGYAGLVALQYANSSGSPAAVFIPQNKERTRYKWSLRTGRAEVGEEGALALAEQLRDLKAPDGASPAGGHAKAMGGICSHDQIEHIQKAMRKWASDLGLPQVRPADSPAT